MQNADVDLLGPSKNPLENGDVNVCPKIEFQISADGRQMDDFRLEMVFHRFLELRTSIPVRGARSGAHRRTIIRWEERYQLQ